MLREGTINVAKYLQEVAFVRHSCRDLVENGAKKTDMMVICAPVKSILEWRPLQWPRFQTKCLAMRRSRNPDQELMSRRQEVAGGVAGLSDSAYGFRAACLG